MLDLSHEPDLGYVFYPPETADHPGHPRLDVILQERPTYRHFDPQKVQYHVVTPQGYTEQIHLYHPWRLARRYRVCAGRIIISDRRGKQVEAFAFGGQLQILSDAQHTVGGLTSPAPIFPLFTSHDLSMWVTAEAEIILARQKAHWDPNHPHAFEAHLAAADPFLLYASCLQAIQERCASLAYSSQGELAHQGVHFIHEEIARLKQEGSWPAPLPSPEQLFSEALAVHV